MVEIVSALARSEKVYINCGEPEEVGKLGSVVRDFDRVSLVPIPTNEPWCRDRLFAVVYEQRSVIAAPGFVGWVVVELNSIKGGAGGLQRFARDSFRFRIPDIDADDLVRRSWPDLCSQQRHR